MRAFASTAMRYWTHGFNVLPTIPRDKRPPAGLYWQRIHGWGTRRQTQNEVEHLIRRFGWCDIAVTTGQVSGGLVAFDVDNTDGGRAYQRLRLPRTWTIRSPRGPKYVFLSPNRVQTRARFADGLDIKSEIAYVVAPPSWGRHEVIGPDHLADLPNRVLNRLAPYRPNLRTSRRLSGGSFNTSLPTISTLRAKGVIPFFRHRAVAERIAALFDRMTAFSVLVDGSNFRCILPGHVDRKPSAVIAFG